MENVSQVSVVHLVQNLATIRPWPNCNMCSRSRIGDEKWISRRWLSSHILSVCLMHKWAYLLVVSGLGCDCVKEVIGWKNVFLPTLVSIVSFSWCFFQLDSTSVCIWGCNLRRPHLNWEEVKEGKLIQEWKIAVGFTISNWYECCIAMNFLQIKAVVACWVERMTWTRSTTMWSFFLSLSHDRLSYAD